MRAWIAIEERSPEITKVESVCLPEDEAPLSSERLLVFDEDEGEQCIAVFTQPVDGDEPFWMDWSSGCTLRGVTHWRHLPDDPEVR